MSIDAHAAHVAVFRHNGRFLLTTMVVLAAVAGLPGCDGATGGGGGGNVIDEVGQANETDPSVSNDDTDTTELEHHVVDEDADTDELESAAGDLGGDTVESTEGNFENDDNTAEDATMPPECAEDGDCPPGEVCDLGGECVVPDPGGDADGPFGVSVIDGGSASL